MDKRFKNKKHRLSENDLENISGGSGRLSTAIVGWAAAYITASLVCKGVRKGLDHLLDKLDD